MNRTGFDATFIKRICAETLDSSAVNHPYLQAFRQGDFPDIHLAHKDFAFQYGLYSSRFTRYLSAVIENLQDAGHRQIIQSNLNEENGDAHDVELPPDVLQDVTGKSHAYLFKSFEEALGVDTDYRATASGCQVGSTWSQQFFDLCGKNQHAGVGAIGIGTELIVSGIYNQILQGLKTCSNLTMTQRVFFEIHSQCDDEHAAQMILIAEDLARDEQTCEQIQYGAQMAVNLRAEFWDKMLERAQSFPASTTSANEALANVGYQTSL